MLRRTVVVILLLLGGIAALGPAPAPTTRPMADVPPWQHLFRGIDEVEFITHQPRLLHIVVARVDLTAPGIGFLVTPPKGKRMHEVVGLRTTTFLEKYNCQLAVNASGFSIKARQEGDMQKVFTLAVSRGRVYSGPAAGDAAALVITRDNHARIARPPFNVGDAYNAVGGMGDMLRDGEVVAGNNDIQPRTAVGVSRDGRYLILMVIDGRQPGYSEGCGVGEAAWWLRQMGAWNGMNLDGGGTSTMAVADAIGKGRLLNRPIDLNIPGKQRIAGSHLGVFALPLGAATRP